jgi:glycosyltransferase involved in cell wall biosynthesis
MIIIVPAYNEQAYLGNLLRALAAAEPGAEILVIDDGSRDATAQIAAEAGARVLRHPFNLGYGAALQTGYKYALSVGADLLIQMDADGQHDPAQIRDLTAPLLAGACDLVIGSRFLEPSGYAMGRTRNLGRQVFRLLGRIAGIQVTDPTSGFQALNRKTLELYAEEFFPHDYPDVDVLVMAARRGIRIQECAVHMNQSPRESTLHGGVRAIYYVYKMVLSLWAASKP